MNHRVIFRRPGIKGIGSLIIVALFCAAVMVAAVLPDPGGTYMQGQIVPDPRNPRWLCRYDRKGDHKPFMLVGPADPEALLYMERAEELVKKLIEHGGNSIYVLADASGDNGLHKQPYIDGKASKGADPDMLDRWLKLFELCDDAGIVVVFIFYDDNVNPWGITGEVTEGEDRLMRQYVEKFGHLKHLFWYFAEEYEEAGNKDRAADWARRMKEIDPYDHIIGFSTVGYSGWGWQDNGDVEQWGIQCNKAGDDDWHDCAVGGWSEVGDMQQINMLENTWPLRGVAVRKRLWAGAMGGAAVNMDLSNRISNATIQELNDMRNMQRFFETTDLYNMGPDDKQASADTNYVLGGSEASYILYSRNCSSRLGLKSIVGGKYDFHWYDIAANRSVRHKALSVSGGSQSWTKPDGFGVEVALHIRRSEPAGKDIM